MEEKLKSYNAEHVVSGVIIILWQVFLAGQSLNATMLIQSANS